MNWRKAGLTYAEIGRRLGVTKERVRQIDKGIASPRKPRPELDVMLTPREVSRMLGVHVNTVRRWSDKGILRAYHIGPRGDRRFRRQGIDNFLLKKSEGLSIE
jgi:excisionase family DNA binding protein